MWSTTSTPSLNSVWRLPWGRGSPRSGCCSTPGLALARRWSTTSSCCVASTSWPRSAARWWWEPRARASSDGSSECGVGANGRAGLWGRDQMWGRRRVWGTARDRWGSRTGSRARLPRACWPTSAARACCACTTSLPCVPRWGGRCYVGRAMSEDAMDDEDLDAGEEAADRAGAPEEEGSWREELERGAPEEAPDQYEDEELDEEDRGGCRVGHDRDHRPVALHPSRRERGGARGRPAADARPAPGGRRNRRHRHRPHRGHRRLRRGVPAGRARRPAAFPHAHWSGCAARSPIVCSPTTSSKGCG